MGLKRLGLLACFAALGVLAMVAAAGGGTSSKHASNALVFGSASDPVIIDGPLVSDGESLRVVDQIFQGLVGLKPGTTQIIPLLATSWAPSKNGLTWSFNLRKNVKFQDGTRFNSAAVCFNFNRWYNFPGPLQNSAVTYYWNTVFGGFAHPAQGNPGPDKSLYKGCRTKGPNQVQLLLTRRSSSFLGALALTNFGIASPTALKKYKADAGTVDSNGVFHPSGTFGTQHPIGTGPYMLKTWQVGNKLEIDSWNGYWGAKAKLARIIFRPIADNAARLQALQSGEIQGFDLVAPQDIPTVKGNSNLKVLDRPAFNVGYVGINQAKPPLNNLKVRQAIAYGLDRASVVQKFYAGRGQVATEFLPPLVEGYAGKGVAKYPFSPNKAKQLLQSAGLTLPVPIEFWYPTSVSRPYMPDPQRNAEAFAASLEQSGFKVTFRNYPWRPDYLARVQNGEAQLFLLGWTGDFGDPANFDNVHFGQFNAQFGFHNSKLFGMLSKADQETNIAKRINQYKAAEIYIMKYLPVVPYVHSRPALAFQKNVAGYIPSPVSLESFATVRYTS